MDSSEEFTKHLDEERLLEYELSVKRLLTDFVLTDFSQQMKELSGGGVKRVALTQMLASSRRRGRVSYEKEDVDRQYGATWFLDRVAEKIGLTADLRSVFGGNMEMVNDVLTMAYCISLI